MKVIVHFGHEKTGTTSLQHALAGHRQTLASHGILYPEISTSMTAHHLLQAMFFEPERCWPHLAFQYGSFANAKRAAAKAWRQLKQDIAKTRPKTLILSSEMFFDDTGLAAQKRFFALLSEISNDIEPVLYIREPASFFLAQTQQNARSQSVIVPPGPRKIRKAIETIEHAFQTKMTLRAFDRQQLAGNDLVVDFVTSFLSHQIGAGLIKPETRNEGISAEAMVILSNYRQINLPDFDRVAHGDIINISQKLRQIEVDLPNEGPLRLRGDIADNIRRASADFLWLAQARDIKFETLNYSEIDGLDRYSGTKSPRIHNLIDVNWERHDLLLYRLLKKKMVQPSSLSWQVFGRRYSLSLSNSGKNIAKIKTKIRQMFSRRS